MAFSSRLNHLYQDHRTVRPPCLNAASVRNAIVTESVPLLLSASEYQTLTDNDNDTRRFSVAPWHPIDRPHYGPHDTFGTAQSNIQQGLPATTEVEATLQAHQASLEQFGFSTDLSHRPARFGNHRPEPSASLSNATFTRPEQQYPDEEHQGSAEYSGSSYPNYPELYSTNIHSDGAPLHNSPQLIAVPPPVRGVRRNLLHRPKLPCYIAGCKVRYRDIQDLSRHFPVDHKPEKWNIKTCRDFHAGRRPATVLPTTIPSSPVSATFWPLHSQLMQAIAITDLESDAILYLTLHKLPPNNIAQCLSAMRPFLSSTSLDTLATTVASHQQHEIKHQLTVLLAPFNEVLTEATAPPIAEALVDRLLPLARSHNWYAFLVPSCSALGGVNPQAAQEDAGATAMSLGNVLSVMPVLQAWECEMLVQQVLRVWRTGVLYG